MLVIRAEQLRVLQEESEREFRRRLTALLRRLFDGTDAVPEALVEHSILKARQYGLTSEKTIADFVGLAVQYGPAFDEHPAVHGLLSNPAFPPDRRMKILFQTMTPEGWRSLRGPA